jgi:hypothetical protein
MIEPMANGVTVTTRINYVDGEGYGPYVENNWHFSYNALLGAGAEVCAESGRAGIIEFWKGGALPSGADSLSGYLSGYLANVIQFRWVDWEDTTNTSHELPSTTIAARTVNNMPEEVATCVTFTCDPYGGHRRQSFYNRVYLGPLATSINGGGGTTPSRPTEAFRLDVVDAYSRLRAELDDIGLDAARHAVYSPKHDSSGVVTGGWIDNAWDIQRRRGIDPTVKTHLEFV